MRCCHSCGLTRACMAMLLSPGTGPPIRSRARCYLRRSLEPDLDLVSVRIPDVGIRTARRKLPAGADRPAGAFDCRHRRIDVLRALQPEPEMDDPATRPRAAGVALEGDDVMLPGSQHLDRVGVAVVLAHPEHRTIEAQ